MTHRAPLRLCVCGEHIAHDSHSAVRSLHVHRPLVLHSPRSWLLSRSAPRITTPARWTARPSPSINRRSSDKAARSTSPSTHRAAELTTLDVQLEQKGRTFPILDLASAPAGAIVTQGDRVRITRPIGKKALPELVKRTRDREGERFAAGLPQAEAGLVRGITRGSGQVDPAARRRRIDPSLRQSGRRGNGRLPRVAGRRRIGRACRRRHLSRVSGHRCADCAIPSSRWRSSLCSTTRRRTRRWKSSRSDIAGNEARAQFEHRVFPKKFRSSRIPLDDKFLGARRAGDSPVVAATESLGRAICCRHSSRSTTTSAA